MTHPPITYFQDAAHGQHDLAPVHVEFLIPMVGRSAAPTVEIAPGVGAQTLRYLDLSFEQVIAIDTTVIPFLDGIRPSTVRVPSPAAYLLGKSLTLSRRKPSKRGKDYAYIYQLALVTRALWDQLERDLSRIPIHPKWRSRGYATLRDSFASPESVGVVAAAHTLDDPTVTVEVVFRVVSRFLNEIGVRPSG